MLVATQQEYPVRFEWGIVGAEAVAAGVDVAVVVDVLSFTTTVSVAVRAGIAVSPYPWSDDGAAQYADDRGAVLADRRRDAPGLTLSPSSIARAIGAGPVGPHTVGSDAAGARHVVLPSPNGSTLAFALRDLGCTVVTACLRDARSVAARVGARRVAVIAAGERWPDGSLRPAVEDLWGAGAVLAALPGEHSPEARVAADAWRAVAGRESQMLPQTTSGRELVAGGFAHDVVLAAEVGQSDVVAVLGPDDAFRGASR